VIRKPNPDIPVYVVRKEDGDGCLKTLHRNLLLPIGSIREGSSDERDNTDANRNTLTKRPIPAPRKRPSIPVHSSADTPADSSDDEDMIIVVKHTTQVTDHVRDGSIDCEE